MKSRNPSKLDQALNEIKYLKKRIAELEKRRAYWLSDITCSAADQSQEIDGVAFCQTIRDSQ